MREGLSVDELPRLALSVRQPWAWAIIHAGKDIENRSWRQPNPGLRFRGRVCIHAASGMTRDEFDDAIETIDSITGPEVKQMPRAVDLIRGGIIGMVDVVDIVRASDSPWFFGPVGLVLRNPEPIGPFPAKGQLGFFEWSTGLGSKLAEPAKWMLPQQPKPARQRKQPAREADLFADPWAGISELDQD